MKYTFRNYQEAINERDSYDMFSSGWKAAQIKMESIVMELMKQHCQQMAMELVDETYSLLEFSNDKEIKEVISKNLTLLRENGFEDMADDLIEEME